MSDEKQVYHRNIGKFVERLSLHWNVVIKNGDLFVLALGHLQFWHFSASRSNQFLAETPWKLAGNYYKLF